jgi:hypothetical protein
MGEPRPRFRYTAAPGRAVVMTQHYAMLERNLLYTGITRGVELTK